MEDTEPQIQKVWRTLNRKKQPQIDTKAFHIQTGGHQRQKENLENSLGRGRGGVEKGRKEEGGEERGGGIPVLLRPGRELQRTSCQKLCKQG